MRLRAAAARDLDAFVAALKSPADAIALRLRLIESERVTPFEAAGLAAAIGTFNEIVVVAPPGTGKTTTLLQVVRGIAANEKLVAAFIPLSEWSAQGQPLLQSIIRRAAFAGEREEHLKLLAGAGRLVLCMDGWNELDSLSRKRLRSEVQGMQRDFPGLGIVMSTRVQALDVPISGPVVEIEPLGSATARYRAAPTAVKLGRPDRSGLANARPPRSCSDSALSNQAPLRHARRKPAHDERGSSAPLRR
ncbi:MAG: hypothetical protein R3E92_08680 [Burkholderiaceae bacterium]